MERNKSIMDWILISEYRILHEVGWGCCDCTGTVLPRLFRQGFEKARSPRLLSLACFAAAAAALRPKRKRRKPFSALCFSPTRLAFKKRPRVFVLGSSIMSRSLGIPVKLLHEASGHVVTVEMKSGELYRGTMIECEDNWNCQLENITYTFKDGKVSQLEHVFIRGSKVRFMIIPDMLKNAPMFKRLDARIKGKGSALGVGRGRAVAMRARPSSTAQAAGRAAPGRGAVPPVRR
ncbi:hypothetical protein ACLOJK_018308 [Asimina triloba]